jgi:hypothetical protein
MWLRPRPLLPVLTRATRNQTGVSQHEEAVAWLAPRCPYLDFLTAAARNYPETAR